MKNNTNSFLFLFIIFCLFFFRYQKLLGQNINDSIPYYINKVQKFKTADDLKKAKVFFSRKLKSTKENDSYILYFKYQLASIEKKLSNYVEAENLLVSILEDIELLPDSNYKGQYQRSTLNLLGNIYREQRNKEKAVELFNRSLNLASSTLDSAIIFNNKSNIYRDFEEFESAKNELVSAYKLFPRFKDTLEKARILDNLGYIYTKLDSTSLGLKFINRGLKLRKEKGIDTEIFESYKKLVKYHQDIGNDSLSKSYVKKAYGLSQKMKIPKLEEEALGMLLEFHPDSNVRRYKKMNDSLTKVKKLGDNKFAMYKFDKAQSEKRALESEFKMLLFAFLGGLIFVIAILLIIFQRIRNKQHTLAQVHKTERDFSKKVHDELGNDIFYLMNQIQTNPVSLLEKEGLQVLNGLNQIYTKARDISKRYATIDTGEEFHNELISLLNSFGNETTNIITNEIEPNFWKSVSKIKKEQLYRILQELLTNMKKHSGASLVGITFTKIKKQIIIKYVDNGKGTNQEKLLVKNGLSNVENRIGEIKGSITFETSPDKGFKAEIRFI